MSQKKKSKEELFLQKLYELASASGDPENEIDRYEVGKLVGENPKGADHTVQMLVKNGFLKRGDEARVYLTERGVLFAKSQVQSDRG